ncbi:MAG: NADPH-dependent F420 reductase [Anaerolineae bacterium]
MKIGILGTGTVGRTLADKLQQLGHSVVIGTRDPADTLKREENTESGLTAMRAWLHDHAEIPLKTMAEAAEFAEMVICAVDGLVLQDALEAANPGNLYGKILVDLTNAVTGAPDGSSGLLVANTESMAERVQRSLPKTRVVKTLNNISAPLMVDPQQLANGGHTVFLCGNDGDARQQVHELLQQMGWSDVIDLGDLSAARSLEMLVLLWFNLWQTLGTEMFNLKVVR